MKRAFAGFAAVLFALIVCFAAHAQEAQPYQAVLDKIGQEKEAFKLKIDKWKFNKNMDSRCIDPNYDPKGWKSTGVGYMWPEFKSVWFRATFKMPDTVAGKPVKGSKVIFHASMQETANLYVNGKFEQYFRRDDGEALLTTSAVPGEEYVIVIEGINAYKSGIFYGAYVTFSALDEVNQRSQDYINKVKTVEKLIGNLPDKDKWIRTLNASAALVDVEARESGADAKYFASLDAAGKLLEPFKEIAKKNTMYLIGYSHIDLAWLWDYHEGEDVWKNTSLTILKLMNEYPEWTYNAGQAHGYEWMQYDYPDIFKDIKKRYKEGRWELVGGTIAEHDGNIPSGESIVRQYLYGKRYFKDKFGKNVVISWTPDSFGYNLGLPQIMRKSGMTGFLTQKINWNDTNRFPYHIFWWQGPDGSKVLTYFPVGGYGESNDAGTMLDQLNEMKARHNVNENLVIFGVGDHGGGVTRTHLNRAFAMKNNPVYPKIEFTTAEKYFNHLIDLSKKQPFPTWNDELYLEYHRGTYTTQANNKRNNRWGEILQEEGEKLSSIAMNLFGTPYPATRIRDGWNIILFNQFHDILPGSSIRAVYEHSDVEYARQQRTLGDVITESMASLESHVNTSGAGVPILLFNPLGWKRDSVVEIKSTFTMPDNPAVLDAAGKRVPSQFIVDKLPDKSLIFVARNVPAGGYAVYHIADAAKAPAAPASDVKTSANSIENKFIKIMIDVKSGNLTSIVDKASGRELIEPGKGGNFIQAYDDRPDNYDAWEIKLGKELPLTTDTEASIVESGPVRATVKFTKKIGASTFDQYVSVYENLPLAVGRIDADWHESHVATKLAFNLNLKSDNTWYEIPYSAIERSNLRDTSAHKAKHEVSAHKWIDYTDPTANFGVSLLNNSKYGYDVKDNVMRMTLLRSPMEPDALADRGKHSIPYALYPHKGDWRAAQTPRRGFEFNYPVIVRIAEPHKGSLPAEKSFFSSEPANVIITVLKKAEDGNETVIRMYEATGKDSTATITLPEKIASAAEINLIEEKPDWKTAPIKISGNKLTVAMGHFEIKTIKVKFKK